MELGGGELKNGGSWLGKHSFKTQGSRFYLLIYLSTYLPTYLPIYLPSFLLPIYLPTYLPIPTYLSTYLPNYLPTYLPYTYYPIYLPTCTNLPIYIPSHLAATMHTWLPILLTYLPYLPDYYSGTSTNVGPINVRRYKPKTRGRTRHVFVSLPKKCACVIRDRRCVLAVYTVQMNLGICTV